MRLWPDRDKPVRLAEIEPAVSYERGLWVLAEDALCPGVLPRWVYGLARDSSGKRASQNAVLTVEAVDCVGNTTRVAVPLHVVRGR